MLKHPPSIKEYDYSLFADQPNVEAIFYIITNLLNGMMYIGSHKFFKYGQWLDGYYHSSQDIEFNNLFWGLKKDIFKYEIVKCGTHQDMKNCENEYGVLHQIHTNPKYYNKAIPNKGFNIPARIELCEMIVNKCREGVFDIVDEDGNYILRSISDFDAMDKHQARKYVDPNKTIKDIKNHVIDNNSIDKTEPITIFGESKELLLDGNRTFLACKNLKQASAGLKQRVIPDWLIEENNITEAEKELMAELLNPRDEVSKEATDLETVYDTLIKHKRRYGIEFKSEYNKKYLKAHHFHTKQIEQIPTNAEKQYEVEEEKNEYGSTYIQWDDKDNCQERIDLKDECDKIEKDSKYETITIIGSAGSGKNVYVDGMDKMRKHPNCKKIILYLYMKDKHTKRKWEGYSDLKQTKKGGIKVVTKRGDKEKLNDRFTYTLGRWNMGMEEEFHVTHEIKELDYLRPKTTEGTKVDENT